MGDLVCFEYKKILILRTNFFGISQAKYKISFSDWIIENLKNKKKIKIPTNIYFNPISLTYIAKILYIIIKRKEGGIVIGEHLELSKNLQIGEFKIGEFKFEFNYLSSTI